MTQPTVGRVVWFWPSINELLALPRAGQPLAAHVAAVSEDGSTVNLQVIDANGYAHACQDVPFFEGGHPDGRSYADWMPYQRAQHAKQDTEHPDPAPLGGSDSPSPNVEARPVEPEQSSLATTEASPGADYSTVTTPGPGEESELSDASAN